MSVPACCGGPAWGSRRLGCAAAEELQSGRATGLQQHVHQPTLGRIPRLALPRPRHPCAVEVPHKPTAWGGCPLALCPPPLSPMHRDAPLPDAGAHSACAHHPGTRPVLTCVSIGAVPSFYMVACRAHQAPPNSLPAAHGGCGSHGNTLLHRCWWRFSHGLDARPGDGDDDAFLGSQREVTSSTQTEGLPWAAAHAPCAIALPAQCSA